MKRCILFYFLILSRFALAQTNLESLHTAIVENEIGKASAIIEKLETAIQQMPDAERSDFMYLKGVFAENKGEVDDAQKCFLSSIETAEDLRCYDPSYYDATLRVMLFNSEKSSYYECVKYGFNAINTPMQTQRGYSEMHGIYSTLVTAMMYSRQFADIPDVAAKGAPIMKEQVDADDDEYYSMSFGEAMAWLMMGHTEKAEAIYEKLCQEKTRTHSFQASLSTLHQEIVKAKEDGWDKKKVRRFQQIGEIGKNLLMANPATAEGSILWKDYLSMIRESLEFFHFDTSDPKDEDLWTQTIANLLVRFYIQCDHLPEREAFEYDNILLCKNFLNYHFGFLKKKPVRWSDIRDALDEGEVAIEISCVPEDILVIKKNSALPLCLHIDSVLYKEVTQLRNNDAIAIDSAYSPKGALAKLWKVIEPALGPSTHTIFISGSNHFSEINYGAIALEDGELVSDKYDTHQMLCSSDIIDFKRYRNKRYRNAGLIGGVDYKESQPRPDEASAQFKDEVWNFSSVLPQNMRSGFHDLPNTLREVKEIGHVMDSIGISHTMRTGKEAAEEYFKSLSNQSPDILHLATHGFMLAPLFNDIMAQRMKDDLGTQYQTVLSQSGLLLAGANKKWGKNNHQRINDGILTSQEIATLNLSHTNLAVLMACKSGLGGTTNLTGVPFGVAYAFKMAGVKQVLCCLWDVDDEVTSSMIKCFYQNLFAIGDANKALMLSRKKLIDSGYASPFYWAPFVLVE